MAQIRDPGIRLALADIPPGRLDSIHKASLSILVRTGVNVHSAGLREMLAGSGASVSDGLRVRIPESLIEQALDTAPSSIPIYDRCGSPSMVLESGASYFGTGSDLIYTLDAASGVRRESVLGDVGRAARLCDLLANIDFVMSYGLPREVEETDCEVEQFRAMLDNTRKPVVMCLFSGRESTERVHDLACSRLAAGRKFREAPNYIVYGQFLSPFQHEETATDRLVFCADHFVPLIYIPTIMLGASGPVTLAGALAMANAECLAGLVMHQLRSPGAPFIYGGCVSPLDMGTTVLSYGAPEWRVADATLAQLARRYGLPVFGTAGATDSGRIDAQAGAEWGYSLMLSALAGTTLIHDVGYMESGVTGSLEALAICDEVVGMVKRVLGGFSVDDSSFGLEAIDRVGPGGHFLDDDCTVRDFRSAVWYPTLFERERVEEGQAGERPDLVARARELVDRALGN